MSFKHSFHRDLCICISMNANLYDSFLLNTQVGGYEIHRDICICNSMNFNLYESSLLNTQVSSCENHRDLCICICLNFNIYDCFCWTHKWAVVRIIEICASISLWMFFFHWTHKWVVVRTIEIYVSVYLWMSISMILFRRTHKWAVVRTIEIVYRCIYIDLYGGNLCQEMLQTNISTWFHILNFLGAKNTKLFTVVINSLFYLIWQLLLYVIV